MNIYLICINIKLIIMKVIDRYWLWLCLYVELSILQFKENMTS